MRAEGRPSASAVASVIASAWGTPWRWASANQLPNAITGSGSSCSSKVTPRFYDRGGNRWRGFPHGPPSKCRAASPTSGSRTHTDRPSLSLRPHPWYVSPRGFGQVLSQLLEGRPLQAGDMHLGDAQALGDLRLRHLVVEAHGHDRPLTR